MEAHFWIATIGIVLYVTSMWIAGVMQGLMWRATEPDGTLTYSFIESLQATYPYYAGMDAATVKILHDAFKKALDDPKVLGLLERYDQPVIYMSPEGYTKFARQTFEADRATIDRLGLRGSM